LDALIFDNLKEKSVIVAGGNGLIGSAIVRALEDYGSDVVCADIRGPGEYFNMAEPSTLKAIINKIKILHAFVNCTYPRDLKTASEGWLNCTELIAKTLSINGGSIINFGSIYGMVGSQEDLYFGTDMKMPTEYAFIKGGIIAASRDIATKYGKYNVRCNVVSPGGVYWHQPQIFVQRYSKRCPLQRMAEPRDIVGMVLFLISDESSYITGQNYAIDGGWTAW